MEKWRKCGGLLIKKKRKVGVGGLVCNIVVYSIDILVTQMPKIHFSYIFNLHPEPGLGDMICFASGTLTPMM